MGSVPILVDNCINGLLGTPRHLPLAAGALILQPEKIQGVWELSSGELLFPDLLCELDATDCDLRCVESLEPEHWRESVV
jgi:hypothetical protein